MERTHDRGSVLAIEDDPDIRGFLHSLLGRGGYVVHEAATGREGLRTFHEARPDVVILDIALPDLEGWEVLSRLRDLSDVPVLVLTATSSEAEKVRCFNAGADDYLTKPFSQVELLARLQALRRRATSATHTSGFDDGHVRVDFVRRRAFLGKVPLSLTPTEYRLLSALVRHAGEVLSADQLVELAWGDPGDAGSTRVKYAVLRLRRKLGWESEDAPLSTVRGFGYRYEPTPGT